MSELLKNCQGQNLEFQSLEADSPALMTWGTIAVSSLMSKLDVNITSNVKSLTCVHNVLYTVRHLFTG